MTVEFARAQALAPPSVAMARGNGMFPLFRLRVLFGGQVE